MQLKNYMLRLAIDVGFKSFGVGAEAGSPTMIAVVINPTQALLDTP